MEVPINGRVAKEPEGPRQLSGGTQVTRLRVAMRRRNSHEKHTVFFSVHVMGRAAEAAAQFPIGMSVVGVGAMEAYEGPNRDGEHISTTYITAWDIGPNLADVTVTGLAKREHDTAAAPSEQDEPASTEQQESEPAAPERAAETAPVDPFEQD